MHGIAKLAWLRHARPALAAALALTALVNLVVFARIDDTTEAQSGRALSVAPSPDFFSMAFESVHSRSRFNLYYALGELAPQSSVTLSPEAAVRRDLYAPFLLSLGAADAVVSTEAEVTWSMVELEDSGLLVAQGDEDSGGPGWQIFVATPLHPAADPQDPQGTVARLLAASGSGTDVASPARAFTVLEVPQPVGSEYGYIVLLVEDSLLVAPQGVSQ